MTMAAATVDALRTAGTMSAALWIALLVDHALGEPTARRHPVVWIGHYLGWAGRRIAPLGLSTARAAPFIGGALAWCIGAAVVGGVALGIERALWMLPFWATALGLGLLLKPLLAWRMLRNEVLAVDAALGVSLEAGRAQLARLVSRDVSQLSEAEVRESALESLAENLNDSVVAPIFWFLLLGLPGAAVYRFANTADAMWGYLGLRHGCDWTWAGKWTARADDALSWGPARITALLLHGLARTPGWRVLQREARRTPSPNSGWPMAAMALRLGLRLGKPGVYVLNAEGRRPRSGDLLQAARFGGHAVRAAVALATLAFFLGAWAACG
jgi:adenosylcobinamide-phosphate synthase